MVDQCYAVPFRLDLTEIVDTGNNNSSLEDHYVAFNLSTATEVVVIAITVVTNTDAADAANVVSFDVTLAYHRLVATI